MILSDLRSYIKKNGQASLGEMVMIFNVEPDALRGMMDHLMDKGYVRRGSPCGRDDGCSSCSSNSGGACSTGFFVDEIYEWTRH